MSYLSKRTLEEPKIRFSALKMNLEFSVVHCFGLIERSGLASALHTELHERSGLFHAASVSLATLVSPSTD